MDESIQRRAQFALKMTRDIIQAVDETTKQQQAKVDVIPKPSIKPDADLDELENVDSFLTKRAS